MEAPSSRPQTNGTLVSVQELSDLVADTLPLDHVIYAFGYGSGVFSQQQSSSSSSSSSDTTNKNKTTETVVVDVILVVDNAYLFHKQNVTQNPHHYWMPPTWIRQGLLGSLSSSSWQPPNDDHSATVDAARWLTYWHRGPSNGNNNNNNSIWSRGDPRVYFNLAPGLKYGIVQWEDWVDDLCNWRYLYIAGRMHKPILPLDLPPCTIAEQQQQRSVRNHMIQQYQQVNWSAALAAAFWLRLSSTTSSSSLSFSEVDLYHTLAGLSYQGDYRMQVGAEDPYKLDKLVQAPGQLARFGQIYRPLLQTWTGGTTSLPHNDSLLPMEISKTQTNSNGNNVDHEPWTLTWHSNVLDTSITDDNRNYTVGFLADHLPRSIQASMHKHQWNLSNVLDQRVAQSARSQSLKGLVTAGPTQAFRYALRKLNKGILGGAGRLFRGR